ncbi:hypothetical protein NUW58_g623 [Xylaria curta]|uniref:Uncharacterized protein n=1 Tax=Xylaria curta TaxID=42375 RepID=A0ACC1PPP8_9PEZI|nr:hypothetical protein NUW58_g623 [Xylaria curta]
MQRGSKGDVTANGLHTPPYRLPGLEQLEGLTATGRTGDRVVARDHAVKDEEANTIFGIVPTSLHPAAAYQFEANNEDSYVERDHIKALYVSSKADLESTGAENCCSP